VGANRFLKPKPVESWTHVRNALEWPKACIQTRNQSVEQSEDCLHLNVFARDATFLNKENALKPIMIWIYGGAFEHGYSSDNLYEPSTLVAISDVIVVSFNYRLGVFGFLSLENTEASGNAGFLDQHMAIKWVYENAKYFGGDNTKITLFGQDAGALSVGYHLFYPESWPYFRNGIMQSGLPIGSSNNIQI
jgi:carboxylesterase type B